MYNIVIDKVSNVNSNNKARRDIMKEYFESLSERNEVP